jgi:hypothetical protein
MHVIKQVATDRNFSDAAEWERNDHRADDGDEEAIVDPIDGSSVVQRFDAVNARVVPTRGPSFTLRK